MVSDNALRNRRILVVEDECLIALDLCSMLDRLGATVVGPVPSMEDAMDILDSLGPLDAAVLDINLGSARVYPLADALEARHVPYVFHTGHDELGLPERYRSVPRCEKPIRIETVVEIVRQQLEATEH
ncbi:MAG: response regulator [Steroidobacteraceae bacterium]